uniref:DCD domain-containing protein n=1 Tax=Kalanchoe fedtschenkoi TaxID=63787 RepID=A0A7N0RFV5_KALFE
MGRNFIEARRGRKPPTGLTPDFGAIFMSNESTKYECLQKKLFGLPSNFVSFVKHVKVGMLLFLFEYESRQLYGVYEAMSDGGVDIVPHAYRSSGKKFPAQVQIRTIWNCQPLLELEFRDAIRDNYYQASKFHFGLSKDQVYHLLRLFHPKRVWTDEARLFSTEHVHQKEHTEDLEVEDHISIGCTRAELDIVKVNPLCNYNAQLTGKGDSKIDGQLTSSLEVPATEELDAISYYQPYDPEKPYFHRYLPCSETSIISSMSGHGSGSPIGLEDCSNVLHGETENVDSYIDRVTRELELGDFIPLYSSCCTESYNPATRTADRDCCQIGSLSSIHDGLPDPSHNCGIQPKHDTQEIAPSSQNDKDLDFTSESSDRGAKVGTKSKRHSVFSRIRFAPKTSQESDANNVSLDGPILEIMEQLHKKHDNWSKKLNRKNCNDCGESNSLRRRESVFSRLRFTSNSTERGSKDISEAGASITNLKMNSGQKVKRKVTENLDSQVAKGTDNTELTDFNSSPAEKYEMRAVDPEIRYSTQKQSKRRKLIRPVLGLRLSNKECLTHSIPDSHLLSGAGQASKRDSGSLVSPANSICKGNGGLAEESLTFAAEGQVSCTSCEDGTDKVTASKAVPEVPVEAETSISLKEGCLSGKPETAC